MKNNSKLSIIIDSHVIQSREGRDHWLPLISLLKSTKCKFAVHSVNRLHVIINQSNSVYAVKLAQEILKDSSINVLKSREYLEKIALINNAMVITNSDRTEEFCKREHVNVCRVETFMSEKISR